MNGKELVERGLRLGIPLWRIEEGLDWQENQGERCAEYDVRKQLEPVVRRVTEDIPAPSTSSTVAVAARSQVVS